MKAECTEHKPLHNKLDFANALQLNTGSAAVQKCCVVWHVELIIDPKKKEDEQQRQQQQQQQQDNGSSAAGPGNTHSSNTAGIGPGGSSSSSSAGRDPLTGLAAAAVPVAAAAAAAEDHPLSLQATSKWHTYFKDNEVMEQIDRDVMRTHPDMHFFSGDSAEAEQHRREMKRCLFMYAKLNPGLRYIQGMNELLAPLYYLARYAEADAFYCFVDLISEFRDHFCQQLDNSSSGIKATIGKLVALLQVHDAELAAHLAQQKVDPQFFAFRWITLLLTQEFSFPDAVRIWDTLLADPGGRMDCLLRVCLALLLNVRQQLLDGDFAVIVKTLQRYPSVDVDVILRAAARLPPCSSVLA
ncbi:rab-GTPase-TBC domain-containing protein [Scenedesmus sp. NREL 46B-D3]|nr:rab-GTPase-TBC domain-containing protein [Scenedesmus sp. NREL 46B-D3]